MRGIDLGPKWARSKPAFDLATLVVRTAIGLTLAYHGYVKLTGDVSAVAEAIDAHGVPLPNLVAHAITLFQLAIGISLMLGAVTRLLASLVALQVLIAALVMGSGSGLIAMGGTAGNLELDMLIVATAFVILLIGPGRWSVDSALGEPVMKSLRRPAVRDDLAIFDGIAGGDG